MRGGRKATLKRRRCCEHDAIRRQESIRFKAEEYSSALHSFRLLNALMGTDPAGARSPHCPPLMPTADSRRPGSSIPRAPSGFDVY